MTLFNVEIGSRQAQILRCCMSWFFGATQKNHIKVEEVKFHMFLFAEQLSGTLPLFGLSFGEHT
jgi:hypothetical protein